MTELDTLIERARTARVGHEAAERYVHELDRWARPVPPLPLRWVPWLVAGIAVAAAVTLALWSGPAREARTPVRIGDRVAIVADPETVYRVVWTDGDDTTIAVERGAVTARLWPGERRHRLALSGLGITATAHGTVYSLAIRADGPVVHVIEGAVDVRTAEEQHVVHAGATWPAVGVAADPAGGRILLALTPPELAENPAAMIDAGTPPPSVADDGAVVAATEAPADAPAEAALGAGGRATSRSVPPADAATIKDRWRVARLLRGQGKFAAALAECLGIADVGDRTWSPIALLEAARIDLGPLADPEGAIRLADRMIREWPDDALAAEARELRCHAMRQLGRGAECGGAGKP